MAVAVAVVAVVAAVAVAVYHSASTHRSNSDTHPLHLPIVLQKSIRQ